MNVFRKESCAIPRVRVISAEITPILNKNDKMRAGLYFKETQMHFPTSYKLLEANNPHNWHTKEDATAKRPIVSRNTANVSMLGLNALTFANVKTA